VIRWHKQGFRLYWRWKSRSRKPGQPKTDTEIHKSIRRTSLENPTRGTPRIRSQLRLLGYEVSKAIVDKYAVLFESHDPHAEMPHVSPTLALFGAYLLSSSPPDTAAFAWIVFSGTTA
jgi:hypothetical protein